MRCDFMMQFPRFHPMSLCGHSHHISCPPAVAFRNRGPRIHIFQASRVASEGERNRAPTTGTLKQQQVNEAVWLAHLTPVSRVGDGNQPAKQASS